MIGTADEGSALVVDVGANRITDGVSSLDMARTKADLLLAALVIHAKGTGEPELVTCTTRAPHVHRHFGRVAFEFAEVTRCLLIDIPNVRVSLLNQWEGEQSCHDTRISNV